MQIEVMSLRGSQWLQLFLEQAQIGQMVEHLHFFLSYSILRIQLFIFTTWYFPAYQPA